MQSKEHRNSEQRNILTPIFPKVKMLDEQLTNLVANFDKSSRHIIGTQIMNYSVELVRLSVFAARTENQEKKKILVEEFESNFVVIEHLLRKCVRSEFKLITPEKYASLMITVESIREKLDKWFDNKY